ncbi:MAG TPA: hypothetical protein VHZ76_10635, partial [Gammaproteobacteria bacterium]|nr:hypothetical protein [Gammaproteobacteria bacterium]
MQIRTPKEASAVYYSQKKSYSLMLHTLYAPSQEKRTAFKASKKKKAKDAARKTFDALPIAAKNKLNRAAFTLQRHWRELRSADSLLPVKLNEIHRLPVQRLLNHVSTIKKNLNAVKQQQLLQALNQNQWDAPIFTDPLFLQTAMALFSSNKINYREMETLIGRYQASIPIAIVKDQCSEHKLTTYPILDKNGNFSEAANKILIPNLDGFMHQNMSNEKLDMFKLLMRAFCKHHPSENSFYTYQLHPLEKEKDGLARVMHCAGRTALYDKNDE